MHHLRVFREQLLAAGEPIAQDAGIRLRLSHLNVFGNIKAEGTRLTDLAAWAGMARPSMAELVDELEADGLLERRPDPTDGRAKLICLTDQGWTAMRTGHRIIAGLEAEYAQLIGNQRFETMCQAMQALLTAQSTASTQQDGDLDSGR